MPSDHTLGSFQEDPHRCRSKKERRLPPSRSRTRTAKRVALKDFKGRNVIVYFYPRDDTPGCTKEAQGFRKLLKKFEKLDAVVIGISPDDAAAHQKFIKKYKLNFPLLCDPDKKVMTKYGAFGEKMMYGKKTKGVIRSTVWVRPERQGQEALGAGREGGGPSGEGVGGDGSRGRLISDILTGSLRAAPAAGR